MWGISPAFFDDFYQFDRGVLGLLKMYPNWMIPGVRAARQRLIDVFNKWETIALSYLDSEDDGMDWKPNTGSKLIRERLKIHRKRAADEVEGHGTWHLSIFWG